MTPLTLLAAFAVLQAALPDFSGVWTLDAARSETLKEGGEIDRGPIVVTQNGESLRIAPSAGEKTVSYPILTATTRAAASAGTDVAFWDGPALITERQGLVGGKSVTVHQARTLDAAHTEMVVDTTVAVQHGYKEGEQLPQSKARDIYIRSR